MCPGAPFLIGGTADAIASRLRPVVDACADVVAGLPAADEILLISAAGSAAGGRAAAGPAWCVIGPGTALSAAPLRRSDQPGSASIRLSGGSSTLGIAAGAPVTASVATMVGASLLAGLAAVDVAAVDVAAVDVAAVNVAAVNLAAVPPTTVVEVRGDPSGAAAMVSDWMWSEQRISVLVIADGSACHGDDAPGRRDDRAAGFDAALAAALAAGDPAALAGVTRQRELARELLATVDPLAVLASLTAGTPPISADVLYSAAPLGVGYLIASWRWSDE